MYASLPFPTWCALLELLGGILQGIPIVGGIIKGIGSLFGGGSEDNPRPQNQSPSQHIANQSYYGPQPQQNQYYVPMAGYGRPSTYYRPAYYQPQVSYNQYARPAGYWGSWNRGYGGWGGWGGWGGSRWGGWSWR